MATQGKQSPPIKEVESPLTPSFGFPGSVTVLTDELNEMEFRSLLLNRDFFVRENEHFGEENAAKAILHLFSILSDNHESDVENVLFKGVTTTEVEPVADAYVSTIASQLDKTVTDLYNRRTSGSHISVEITRGVRRLWQKNVNIKYKGQATALSTMK